MQKYFVIIGDMVQSKALKNRQKIQDEFQQALGKVQKQYGQGIVSPLTVTIGDEFQAVLNNASQFFCIVNKLDEYLPNIRFRYGLGIGTIATALNRQEAIGMDGPAFHFARQALEQARQLGRRFVFYCQPSHAQKRIDLLFQWIDVITKNWSKEKQRILHLSQLKLTQKAIAAQIGISQPAVSQHVRQPIFQLVLKSQEVIQEEMNALLEKSDE